MVSVLLLVSCSGGDGGAVPDATTATESVRVPVVGAGQEYVVDPWEITNGVAGKNNVSRHVVYVGGVDGNNKPKDTRTEEQKEALARYVKEFRRQHPEARIVGHNELSAKACPSFDVRKWLYEIGVNPR